MICGKAFGESIAPMSGLVMMSIILGAVGLPLEGMVIILAVDRVLDMFHTMVNVLSDSCGAVVVAKLDGEDVLGPRLVSGPANTRRRSRIALRPCVPQPAKRYFR